MLLIYNVKLVFAGEVVSYWLLTCACTQSIILLNCESKLERLLNKSQPCTVAIFHGLVTRLLHYPFNYKVGTRLSTTNW